MSVGSCSCDNIVLRVRGWRCEEKRRHHEMGAYVMLAMPGQASGYGTCTRNESRSRSSVVFEGYVLGFPQRNAWRKRHGQSRGGYKQRTNKWTHSALHFLEAKGVGIEAAEA